MKPRLILFLSALVLVSLACQAVVSDSSTNTEPPVDRAEVLFQDDFANPASGWDRVDEAAGITDYEDGVYRILVNEENTDIWANPGLNFSDLHIEVDATKMGGDDNNDFGLICRYVDAENFYFMIISSDGYYGVGKVVAGEQQLIGTDSMPPSDEINQGNATNHLRADCVDKEIALYVNGELLAEYEDSQFSSGDVGLIAGSFDLPGTEIYFDNFVVLKP
ncbi:MAG TPA: hypothetical protein VJL34_00325 [Anaerolineales bacterium]|nr:hypothetical protein [Anaerolineales bacterium]